MTAVISADTSRITLGTTVTGLLARDPVNLAREALTLSELTDTDEWSDFTAEEVARLAAVAAARWRDVVARVRAPRCGCRDARVGAPGTVAPCRGPVSGTAQVWVATGVPIVAKS